MSGWLWVGIATRLTMCATSPTNPTKMTKATPPTPPTRRTRPTPPNPPQMSVHRELASYLGLERDALTRNGYHTVLEGGTSPFEPLFLRLVDLALR